MRSDQWAAEQIRKLEAAAFFGKIIFIFEKGKITSVKKEEVLKPPNFSAQ